MEPVYIISGLILLALILIGLCSVRDTGRSASDAERSILSRVAIAWIWNTQFDIDNLPSQSPTDGQLHDAFEGLREKLYLASDIKRARQQIFAGMVPEGFNDAEIRLFTGLIRFNFSDQEIMELFDFPYSLIEKGTVIEISAI